MLIKYEALDNQTRTC